MKYRIMLMSAALLFAGSVLANAQTRKETRTVEPFHTVVTKGSEDVYVKQGNTQSLVIEADEDVLKDIVSEVHNGVLKIGLEDRWFDRTWTNKRIKVYVTMPVVKGFKLSGSGEIIGEGDIKSDDLSLTISGSGKIRMNVFAETISSEISGSGDVRLSGTTTEYNCRISGSGNIDAMDLRTENCRAKISGAGDARVSVSGDLDVQISGSGNIAYAGDPKTVNTRVSGSGNVRKMK
ncbi:MAG: DUF2807 domain-containing protein [Bacteroidetes bacterium]|nr:DUF2807 domain-containing protein [Bacteroidota bacterium]